MFPMSDAVADPLLTSTLDVPATLLLLVVVFVAAKTLGEIAERLNQPAVAGEILAGILLGGSVLGYVNPGDGIVHLFSEIGVLLLMFTIGLETDLTRLLKVGGTSLAVAITGVVLPFGLGYGTALLFGLDTLGSIAIGAALTATSVGITARVLSDMGRLDEPEAHVIMGAAVLDDVIGLILLAIFAQVAAGGTVTAGSVVSTTLMAFGFIVVLLLVGRPWIPRLFERLALLGKIETVAAMAVALAFFCAVLAVWAGSAMIIGAFVAGLLIQPSPWARPIEHGVGALARLFIPVFFVSVGAAVDLGALMDPAVLGLAGALLVVGFVGKFAAGYVPVPIPGQRSVVGMGMVPRGEVGLIFAQIGLATGALAHGPFSALTLMVLASTLVAPVGLRRLFAGRGEDLRRAEGSPTKLSELMTEV